jgi:CheY-like chemotaxis protein
MAGFQILVVDDDPRIRTLLMRVLAADRHTVRAAESAEQCLEMLHEELPDLLCVDLILPGMDGLALTRRIREDLYDLAPPIILISGSLDELESSELAEFQEALPKPFKLDALRRAVARHARPDARRTGSVARMSAVRPEDREDDDRLTG